MNFHQHCFFQLAHLQVLQCKLMQISQSLQQLAMFFGRGQNNINLCFEEYETILAAQNQVWLSGESTRLSQYLPQSTLIPINMQRIFP